MTLEEQFTRDTWYMDVLASQANMDEMFTSRVNLLPPDLAKQVEKGWRDKGYTDMDK